MKKSLTALASILALTTVPTGALAETTFNLGLVSDYRYRGISQSRLRPALQGGADYSNGGFYVGTWASTIKWIKDAGTIFNVDTGSANLEVDVYGGYKGEITKGLGFDVGALTYIYPGNKLANITVGGVQAFKNANTAEVYGALTWGPATVKYSHALSNLFGNLDSKNSFYVDGTATFEGPWGLSIAPHIGYQKVKGPYDSVATYTDYSLTVSKDFSGLVVSIAAVGTDADKGWYVSPSGKFLGKSAIVVGVKKNF